MAMSNNSNDHIRTVRRAVSYEIVKLRCNTPCSVLLDRITPFVIPEPTKDTKTILGHENPQRAGKPE